MAKKKTMPLNEAIQEVLETTEDNPLRSLLELICQQALEVEISDHLGAEPYERTGDRTGYRNGYKTRTLTTAVGDLQLLVPQDRDGTFSTHLFERYQRSDKALVLALMEMYVKGVSTRKVSAITEKLCGKSFSSQLVSKLARDLDASVESWRTRPLEGDRPYLLVDARYEKVRINGRVISQGILIVIAINPEGKREIAAVEVADTENATTWSELFKSLKKRGLTGVKMVTSDDHEASRQPSGATSREHHGSGASATSSTTSCRLPQRARRRGFTRIFALSLTLLIWKRQRITSQRPWTAGRSSGAMWQRSSTATSKTAWPASSFPSHTGSGQGPPTAPRGSTRRYGGAPGWYASSRTGPRP